MLVSLCRLPFCLCESSACLWPREDQLLQEASQGVSFGGEFAERAAHLVHVTHMDNRSYYSYST